LHTHPSLGIAKLLHFPFSQGCPVIIQQRFDAVKFCAVIEKYRVTTSLVVPPVLVTLVRHPGAYTLTVTIIPPHSGIVAVDEYDLSSVEVLFSGAAPLAHSLVKSVCLKFNLRFGQVYRTLQVKERLLAKRGGRGVLAVTQGTIWLSLLASVC
jgi:acyl-coenzyme A synthetase/AMP-(fatty) acid ligase